MAYEQNLVCFSTFGEEESWTLKCYEKHGGYEAWRDILAGNMAPEQVIDEVKASGLRGRGGAGFPTGLKWTFMPKDAAVQKYLVCNSDESEPGTCHDREVLRYNPHSLVEGMAIAAYAMGATVGYNYIRGEFIDEPIPRFEAAIKEAYAAGLLGRNIQGSGIDVDLHAFVPQTIFTYPFHHAKLQILLHGVTANSLYLSFSPCKATNITYIICLVQSTMQDFNMSRPMQSLFTNHS